MTSFNAFWRITITVVLTVLSFLLIVSAGIIFLITTAAGGRFVIHSFLKQSIYLADIKVASYSGSLNEGFILKDVQVAQIPHWPRANIRLQELRVQVPWWNWQELSLSVLNGRIFLPLSDPLVFNGHLRQGVLDGNIYAKSLDAQELAGPFLEAGIAKYLQGTIQDVDLQVKGPLEAFRLTGHAFANQVRYKTTVVSDTFARVDLTLNPTLGIWPLTGEVLADSGLVEARQVMVDLRKSKITFKGDIYNPQLDIYGDTQVEDIEISFSILGTALKPQLKIDSDPPLPEDVLLLVLATGKSWSGASSSLGKGNLSSDLMGGFVDYFLLGGKGGEFSKTYGLKVGVELEQIPTASGGAAVYSRKLEGEVAVSDHVSVNISKKVLPQERSPSRSSQQVDQEGETQIYLKYQEKF